MKVSIVCLIALCAYVESVAVQCKFEEIKNLGYRCDVKSIKITSKDDRIITEIIGDHLSGRSNSDLKFFDCQDHIIKFFPLELAAFFKNLEIIYIFNATLSELHSSDLQQFGGKLKNFDVNYNEIEDIEAGLFQYNENVEVIAFSDNKLKHIESGAFRGLNKLTDLYLNGRNPCIDRTASSRSEVIALIPEAESKCMN